MTSDDFSEIIHYDFEHIPIKTWKTQQIEFPNHWHNDLEFTYMVNGSLLYNVNSENILLEAGQCIFINSGNLHSGVKCRERRGEFICLIIHPAIISEKIAGHLLESISSKNSQPYIIFDYSNPKDKRIIDLITTLHSIVSARRDYFEFDIMSNVYALLGALKKRMDCIHIQSQPGTKQLDTLRRMTGFIQKNYYLKITVNDIAVSGLVCKRSCCNLFRHFLDKTPNDYLTEYRIYKATELLRETNYCITEVGSLCGFCSSSYFTKVFGKIMKCTPKEYRKSHMI